MLPSNDVMARHDEAHWKYPELPESPVIPVASLVSSNSQFPSVIQMSTNQDQAVIFVALNYKLPDHVAFLLNSFCNHHNYWRHKACTRLIAKVIVRGYMEWKCDILMYVNPNLTEWQMKKTLFRNGGGAMFMWQHFMDSFHQAQSYVLFEDTSYEEARALGWW